MQAFSFSGLVNIQPADFRFLADLLYVSHAADERNDQAGRPGGLHNGHYAGRKLRRSCETFTACQTICASQRRL